MDKKENFFQASKKGSKPIIKSLSNSNRPKINSNYDLKRYKMLNHINKKIKFKKLNHILNTVKNRHQDEIKYIKNDMPYIPSIEKQKSEINFINLVKALSKSTSKEKINNDSKENIFNINKSVEDPYKPRGYDYFSYSREHPELILDNKNYLKIIYDLNLKSNVNDQNNNCNNERYLSHKDGINHEYINKYDNDKISLIREKKSNNQLERKDKVMPNCKSCEKYIYTLNNNYYDKIDNYHETLKSKRKFNSININNNNLESYNKVNKNNSNNETTIFPLIHSANFGDSNSTENNVSNKFNGIKFLTNNDYTKSDIFNLKDDNLSKIKTSEKYLYKKNYKPLSIDLQKKTNISNVGWFPKELKNKSRISISSVEFNILCPNIKNISPTKKDIDTLNKNNTYKANLMSEFVDKCKPGDTELRKDYNNTLNQNKNIFHRKNYCASYNDLHHEYKDLILDLF
jgi:hypothetical protein